MDKSNPRKLCTRHIDTDEDTIMVTVVVWQDEDRTWIEVERVYATRYDCPSVPEGVRCAA